MMLITLSGCSASKHGKLTSNKDVAQAFQGYQILPNHKYYYRGVYSKPTVIVGINQNYKLNLQLWVAIDRESKDLRILIDRVNFQGMGNPVQPWGFTILDRDGKEVGVWYSALRAAAVEIEENGQIVKLFPMGLAAVGDQRQ
jgi:hypothetical protein